MTTMNPFDLLGDNDNDDLSVIIETASIQLQKLSPKKVPTQPKVAKLPTKPLPPSQAVQEAKTEAGRGGRGGFGRGGGGGGGRGRGGGGGGFNREYSSNENAFGNAGLPGGQGENGEGGKPFEKQQFGAPRGAYRGGGRRGGFNNDEGRDGDRRRGGFNNDEGRDGERRRGGFNNDEGRDGPRRPYERRSGTGHGTEIKRDGAGRGNWGTQSDEVAPPTIEEAVEETEKNLNAENLPVAEDAVESNKDAQPDEAEVEKEPEEKEMTLEEYEKLLEEKRKALSSLKSEERKVVVDKDFETMQQLSNKKDDQSVFIKLSSDKDKKKEVAEKEKAKKSVSINEFLKPADGEKYYNPAGGRGRGRGGGRGPRGGGYTGGGYSGGYRNIAAPSIEDPGQFPTLSAK